MLKGPFMALVSLGWLLKLNSFMLECHLETMVLVGDSLSLTL